MSHAWVAHGLLIAIIVVAHVIVEASCSWWSSLIASIAIIEIAVVAAAVVVVVAASVIASAHFLWLLWIARIVDIALFLRMLAILKVITTFALGCLQWTIWIWATSYDTLLTEFFLLTLHLTVLVLIVTTIVLATFHSLISTQVSTRRIAIVGIAAIRLRFTIASVAILSLLFLTGIL